MRGALVHHACLAASRFPLAVAADAAQRPLLTAARRCAHACATPAELDAARAELATLLAASPRFRADWLRGELASDHAGETGAVKIYAGAASALAVRRAAGADADSAAAAAASFVARHRASEEAHLALFDELLPAHGGGRSALLPAWRAAGYALGFAPTLAGGPPALFATVAAVETFVVRHYQAQLGPLRAAGDAPALCALLERCCADEAAHRDEAAAHGPQSLPLPARAWAAVVAGGSAAAVWLARRV